MKDLLTLVDACCEAYDQVYHGLEKGRKPPFQPVEDDPKTPANERTTYCNLAVRFVAERMGYLGFAGRTANEMIDVMSLTEREWVKVPMESAQDHANLGSLVVAGQKDDPHGHVCVVRPGRAALSSKWARPAPKVVQVGATNFIGKPVNYVFKDPPEFFMWAGSV